MCDTKSREREPRARVVSRLHAHLHSTTARGSGAAQREDGATARGAITKGLASRAAHTTGSPRGPPLPPLKQACGVVLTW